MVAYNFQVQFAALAASAQKTQTIHGPGTCRHARFREPLQLYTGTRTVNFWKIIEPDPVCDGSVSVTIGNVSCAIDRPSSGGWNTVGPSEFVRADGFADWREMRDRFNDFRRLPIDGVLIRWQPPLGRYS